VQRCAASKSLANRRKERENDREYGISNLSPASFKFNYFNENGVFGRDQVRIVAELKSERDRLSQAIAALEGLSPRATAKRSAVPNFSHSQQEKGRPSDPRRQEAIVGNDEEAMGG
jgi:hypothetical protein